jgi:hypothetical protein
MKSLEEDRGRRYEAANGLTAELARYLNDEAVVARPPLLLSWRTDAVGFTLQSPSIPWERGP